MGTHQNRNRQIVIAVAIGAILVAICSAIVFVCLSISAEPAKQNYIEYNDNVSDLTFFDVSGQESRFDKETYKIVVYLSGDCGTCVDALPVLNEINQIYCKDEVIKMYLLWEDRIPKNQVEENKLLDNSFSLNNVSISSSLDTVFVLNEKNEVIFVDSNGYENVLKFLNDKGTVNNETLVQNSNNFIISEFSEQNDLPDLVYFGMPGCPDCEEADEIVMSQEIQDRFDITRIERDKNAAADDIVDKLGIFKEIYKIDWYPSFLIIDNSGNYTLIGKTEAENLKQTILSSINDLEK